MYFAIYLWIINLTPITNYTNFNIWCLISKKLPIIINQFRNNMYFLVLLLSIMTTQQPTIYHHLPPTTIYHLPFTTIYHHLPFTTTNHLPSTTLFYHLPPSTTTASNNDNNTYNTKYINVWLNARAHTHQLYTNNWFNI